MTIKSETIGAIDIVPHIESAREGKRTVGLYNWFVQQHLIPGESDQFDFPFVQIQLDSELRLDWKIGVDGIVGLHLCQMVVLHGFHTGVGGGIGGHRSQSIPTLIHVAAGIGAAGIGDCSHRHIIPTGIVIVRAVARIDGVQGIPPTGHTQAQVRSGFEISILHGVEVG